VGIDDDPECAFSRATLNRVGADPSLVATLEASMVRLAQRLVEREPAVGAIVFECTNMPPFADAVQRAVNLPIFDAVTLINMVHEAVTRRPYRGHL
jgi:Asp/Glu/hydantoin racemase